MLSGATLLRMLVIRRAVSVVALRSLGVAGGGASAAFCLLCRSSMTTRLTTTEDTLRMLCTAFLFRMVPRTHSMTSAFTSTLRWVRSMLAAPWSSLNSVMNSSMSPADGTPPLGKATSGSGRGLRLGAGRPRTSRGEGTSRLAALRGEVGALLVGLLVDTSDGAGDARLEQPKNVLAPSVGASANPTRRFFISTTAVARNILSVGRCLEHKE
mmetsp:Transcript_44124/g.116659  ORF Transcript_44124/g.116659 Transcript_44124/m.116659 type:complete len:212 (-) Transcript_44124:185-820(-)